jgi:hypothetical protein
MEANLRGGLGSSWKKRVVALLTAALLVTEQGFSIYAAAADVVEGVQTGGQLNLGGNIGNRGTLPQLPASGVPNLGVNVEVPATADLNQAELVGPGATIGAQVEPTVLQTVEGPSNGPQAEAGVELSQVHPAVAEELTTPITHADTGVAAAPKNVEAQTGGLSQALAKPQKSSGSMFSLFSRFFDRRAKSAASDQTPSVLAQGAAPVIAARDGQAPQKPTLAPAGQTEKKDAPAVSRRFVEFNVQYLKDIKSIFKSSATKPNKQDYIYLATKTFGINLIVRTAFAIKGVHSGQIPLMRAILATSWYQLQDAGFTVFGQTYMKFLGKMTGMIRIGKAKLGDLGFVYVQLVASEFINRLVLGPLGENPLVYSPHGIGLLLLNNLQGMISGGLLVPVINKARKAGLISEKASNNLYQLTSLTMHLGLLATFGYQSLFTTLTTILMVLSWSLYIGLSFFAKEKPELADGGKL